MRGRRREKIRTLDSIGTTRGFEDDEMDEAQVLSHVISRQSR